MSLNILKENSSAKWLMTLLGVKCVKMYTYVAQHALACFLSRGHHHVLGASQFLSLPPSLGFH